MTSSVSRRKFIQYTGCGVGTVTLAGCSGQSGSTPTGTERERNNEKATPYSDDYLSGETIKIGVLAPMARNHPWGRTMINSVEMAVAELQKNQGFLGANIEIEIGNTKLAPKQTIEEHRNLTVNENVDFTVGPMAAHTLVTLMDSIARHKTINFSVGTGNLEPTRLIDEEYEKYKYQFRAGPLNVQEFSENILNFIDKYSDRFEWGLAGVIMEDYYGLQPVDDVLKKRIEDVIDVAGYKNVSSGINNFTPVYDEFERAGVDVAFTFQSLSGKTSVKQWGDQKRDFALGGMNIKAMLPSFYEEVGGAAEYMFSINQLTPQVKFKSRTTEYFDKYIRTHNEVPIYTGPISFDAVGIYAKAVRRTGTTDTERLIPALENIRYEKSISMPFLEFRGPDSNFPHDIVWTSMEEMGVPVWMQWQEENGNGVMNVFAPEQTANAEYEAPPWTR